MENRQLKGALVSACPVVFKGQSGKVPYQCVSAIIYRKRGEEIVISVEIKDMNKNSVLITTPDKIERAEIGTVEF